ncbi:cysteine desulfurase [Candidatus Parcubacteria bacterium]|nr:cysteine desulfurase [Candidatus Parcubacteria bacterium]
MKKLIYLDHAAATPTDSRVIKVMNNVLGTPGNPSSFNNAGREAKKILTDSRAIVARFLNARSEEIVFTGSGSEANNLALTGFLSGKKGTVLTTPIEHPSVLNTLKSLSDIKVKYLSVDKDGVVDLKSLEKSLSRDTLMVSVMYANNEIGTIEPIKKVSKIIKTYNPSIIFHTDAAQAAGYLDMDVQRLGLDLLSFNGSKIYGPKGIGALYVRRGIQLNPLIHGGSQEYGLRAGTENISAVIGIAEAIKILDSNEANKTSVLRDYFIDELKQVLPEARINGPENDRLPNNINISIPDLESEQLLLELDKYGIAAGSGSACTSHSVEPSHVLKAIGVKSAYLDGALRFSIGRGTTKKDLDQVLKVLPKILLDLRKIYSK